MMADASQYAVGAVRRAHGEPRKQLGGLRRPFILMADASQ